MTIRAILIETQKRTISEIRLPPAQSNSNKQLRAMQDRVGGYIEQVHTFPNGDLLMVNDDGHATLSGIFTVYGLPNEFVGNALIVGGPDRAGNITSTLLAVEQVGAFVRFPTSS